LVALSTESAIPSQWLNNITKGAAGFAKSQVIEVFQNQLKAQGHSF